MVRVLMLFKKYQNKKRKKRKACPVQAVVLPRCEIFWHFIVTKNNRFFSVKFLIGLAILSCVDTLVRSFYKMHTNDMHFIDARLKDGV